MANQLAKNAMLSVLTIQKSAQDATNYSIYIMGIKTGHVLNVQKGLDRKV